MICPHCGKETVVIAVATDVTRLVAPVIVDKRFDSSGHPLIEWENIDVKANIRYVCERCGESLADDLDALHEMKRGEQGSFVS